MGTRVNGFRVRDLISESERERENERKRREQRKVPGLGCQRAIARPGDRWLVDGGQPAVVGEDEEREIESEEKRGEK